MDNRILIAYASKYGATAEIARKIGDVLGQSGWSVDVVPIEAVNDQTRYKAVVLGSAVYAGQWLKNAVAFLEHNQETLARMPVWFFSSGPTGEGDPVQLMKGWNFPEAQRAIADRIQPRDIAFFHGELDTKKLNFGEKLIVRGFKAPIGDFRKWDEITAWAASIDETVRAEALLA